MDTRKNVKVVPLVKNRLNDVRKKIGFRTESETIAYLTYVHEWALDKMPTGIYREAQRLARESKNQMEMILDD